MGVLSAVTVAVDSGFVDLSLPWLAVEGKREGGNTRWSRALFLFFFGFGGGVRKGVWYGMISVGGHIIAGVSTRTLAWHDIGFGLRLFS